MIYSVNTNNNPVVLNLNVESNKGQRKLIIGGFDSDVKNTKYFLREMIVSDNRDYTFNMPISPKKLHFVIYDFEENKPYEKSNLYKINNLSVSELPINQLNYNKKTLDFIKFAKDFCLQAGYLNEGSYSDKDRQYDLRYFSEIKDVETKEVIHTPARIHKTENYIEVSQAYFHKLTVPSRFVILMHEFAHNFLNIERDNEIESDINALKVYLDCQFPVIEAIYAFTQIFHDSKQTKERLNTIIAFLSHYEKSNINKNYYKQIYEQHKNR